MTALECQGGEAALGLVRYSTTRTDYLEIDAQEARLKRLRRAVKWSAGCFEAIGGLRPAMVTLTYAPTSTWQQAHVSRFLDAAKKYMKRRGHPLRYVWVAELQERGEVHFHVLLWLPPGIPLPKPDERGWWPHGFSRIERVRNAVGYVCKYASKLSQKVGKFPRGLRLHGCGGLERGERLHRRHYLHPDWLRRETAPFHALRRAEGGGWVSPITAECFSSPYVIDWSRSRFRAGRIVVINRSTLGESHV